MSKQQKGTPSPGPLRGYPAPGRHLAGGQKLAALRHLSSFIAKRPPGSGGGERGDTNQNILKFLVGAVLVAARFVLKLPSLLKEGLGVVGINRPATR